MTNHFDPRLRRAGVRAYNRWLAEFCAANTGRHLGIAVVPIDDVAAAVQEVEWARDAGLRSVSLPPISDAYPHYNDACYEPFWEACAVLNMPLQAHGASTVWYGTGPDHYALTLAECDFFTRRSLWFLIFSGVFDRHPDLNLVFTEQRAGWVVQTLADMDSIYEFQPSGLQQILAQRPSWYFARIATSAGVSCPAPSVPSATASESTGSCGDRIIRTWKARGRPRWTACE